MQINEPFEYTPFQLLFRHQCNPPAGHLRSNVK